MDQRTKTLSSKRSFDLQQSQSHLLQQIGEKKVPCKSARISMKRNAESSDGSSKKSRMPRIAYEASGSGGLGEEALRNLLQTTINMKNGVLNSEAAQTLTDGPLKGGVAVPTSEDALRAICCADEADYALIPIENSLTGTLHHNYELILRYNLYIVGEVEHDIKLHLLVPANSSAAETGVKNIRKVVLAPAVYDHCSGFIQNSGLSQEYTLSMEEGAETVRTSQDPSLATIGTPLIASTYGLKILNSYNIQNNEADITRYLLVGKQSVTPYLTPGSPAKTSVIFCLPDEGGALYRALSCFSLREVDLTKIESRRTNRDVLRVMESPNNFGSSNDDVCQAQTSGKWKEIEASSLRFAYAFHLDFLGSEFDSQPSSALAHLKEQSQFVRVLGSYPRNGQLVGPVKDAVMRIAGQVEEEAAEKTTIESQQEEQNQQKRLKIGIVGFGNFGQFLAKTFVKYADVYGINRSDKTAVANKMGVKFYPSFDMVKFLQNDLDVIIMCTSVISFEQMLGTLPKDQLRDTLVVDVLSVKMHPKEVMLSSLPPTTDILCTHPMFGPESGKYSWQGLPFVFDQVRISNQERANRFLAMWEVERCKMVEMSCELHDEYAANSQFITHLMGRILGQQGLSRTPIDTKGFENVLNLVDTTCSDSFDLFYSLYKYNSNSEETLRKLRESFALVERQIAAKEAYLAAREIAMNERQDLLIECRSLIKEVLTSTALKASDEDGIMKAISDTTTKLADPEKAPPS
mmetsp:Transcript_15060/g.19866  ORF Transcript_15060/g.19866 Transcript_15060/m.19866 type:complete len:746 (+) Transcript_15060:128-2365(+)